MNEYDDGRPSEIKFIPDQDEFAIVLFNRNTASPWQAKENTVVMISSRSSDKAFKGDIFCRAIDVRIGDNVWEHNIVQTIELLAKPVEGIKFHYGSEREGPELVEDCQDEIDEYFHCFTCGSDLSEACMCGEGDGFDDEYVENLVHFKTTAANEMKRKYIENLIKTDGGKGRKKK